MAAADLHALVAGRDQAERDADILAAAQEIVRIEQTEGEAEQRGVGSERDVALVPSKLDAEGLLTLVKDLVHHAHIAHVGGVGAVEL